MSPLEAQPIIEALAKGIDPDTGELLPKEGVFNSPQVIRALFEAVKALQATQKKADRNKSLPSNAGKPWSEDEDKKLVSSFDAGKNVNEIASIHGRTVVAVESRLVLVGRVADRAVARRGVVPSVS